MAQVVAARHAVAPFWDWASLVACLLMGDRSVSVVGAEATRVGTVLQRCGGVAMRYRNDRAADLHPERERGKLESLRGGDGTGRDGRHVRVRERETRPYPYP